MKILTIAYDLPPLLRAQSIQVGRVLYHLPKEYELYLVTSDDLTCKKDENFYKDLPNKFVDLIKIRFKRGLGGKISSRLFLILYNMPDIFLFWHLKAYKEIVRRWGRIKFDYIFTFPYPFSSAILGLALKRYFKTKWICFFSDPWANNEHFGYKNVSRRINSYLERVVLENVDMVIFPSEELRRMYINKYAFIEGKAKTLEHAYDPSLYDIGVSAENKKLVLRHIGSFYKTRNAEFFLKAIKDLADKKVVSEKNFLFEIIGDLHPKYKKEHLSLIDRYDISNMVKVADGVSYLESLKLMQEASVLLLIDAPIPGSVYLPSKLIDYIGADRPIFALTPGSGASAKVMSAVGGWIAEPDDICGIEERLSEIMTHYKNGGLDNFRPKKEDKLKFDISGNIKKLNAFIGVGR